MIKCIIKTCERYELYEKHIDFNKKLTHSEESEGKEKQEGEIKDSLYPLRRTRA